MGTKIKDIIVHKEVTIQDLAGKMLVVDTFNVLYQFLTTIRQRDGSLLTDSKGRVTSHLTGLFSRTTKLMQHGLKLAFVFDGGPPRLKQAESARRKEKKQEALQEYEVAKERKDIEGMKKFAARTTSLTKEMITDAQELITALGLPMIQAPSEGEAQAAFMVKQGHAYAEISQDMDCLMFGVPKLVRNLTITERKKMPGRLAYETIKPELIDLEENLNLLKITQEQLIALGMLVGTDYNPGGIKGICPKNALKLVHKWKENFAGMFAEVKWDEHCVTSWQEVFGTIKNIPVNKEYELQWKPIDEEKLISLLVEQHDFSRERIENTLETLGKEKQKKEQKGLGGWIS